MPTRKKLPIGIQSFSYIREENYNYLDKSKQIYELISSGACYFLSRPRRFGKSLLISTLQELFRGNKTLFKDLYISQTDYDWKEYPVLTLNLSSMDCSTAQTLKKDLEWALLEMARTHNIDIKEAPSLKSKFTTLVSRLATAKGRIVILVDEYDYPLIQNINNEQAAEECREVLHNFFVVLKDLGDHIRFILITGVSKFSKASVFSGLNNLNDISLSPKTNTILGYTQDEIRENFAPYLADISQENTLSIDEILEEVKEWYNGYQFTDTIGVDDSKVYNPFSVLSYLSDGRFRNYWAETGTPYFFAHLIKTQNYSIATIDGSEVNIDETKSFELTKFHLVPLLWQTGYLTIASYNPATQNYKLRYPNKEVKISFFTYFMGYLTDQKLAVLKNHLAQLTASLRTNDLNVFFENLKVFFATIPYTMQLSLEKYYQSLFYVILTIIGTEIQGEAHTNNGRIDAVIETTTHVYLFEFKLNGTAKSALQQIEDKCYYQKYLLKEKKITLIGVNFNAESRNIEQWLIKEL